MRSKCLFAALLALAPYVGVPPLALAASTVRLPASLCPDGDAIFFDGYEAIAIPHDPSDGSGGSAPGNVTRSISVPGVGTRNYYLRIPPDYSPAQAVPLMLALHGAGGPGTAPAAAQQVRADWASHADDAGFIVLAPIAGGSSGGWIVNEPLGVDDDVEMMLAAIADAESAYNIERSRIYLWGFSAGGHVAHAVALNDIDTFAAYGVSAGALRAVTCSVSNDPNSPPCATFLGSLARKIPVDIHVGTADSLYPELQADRNRFTSAGWTLGGTLQFVTFGGGHVYTVAHLGQIWNDVCPYALGP